MKTKTRSKFIILIGMLALSLCFAAGITVFSSVDAASYNDVTACNQETTATQAVTVEYNGAYTGRYGIQAYAGLSGRAWIIGEESAYADQGKGSHRMGSNTTDGRSNFVMTLSIDSSVQGDAYIYLNVETSAGQTLTVKVNDGEPSTHTFRDEGYSTNLGIPLFRPQIIKITLAQGINTVTLTTGENYHGWYDSFAISPDDNYRVIDYDGTTTGKYAIQTYADFETDKSAADFEKTIAYAMDAKSTPHDVDFGKGAGAIGSNARENRSNLKMTINVNSSVAGASYLYLYIKDTSVNEPLSVKINEEDAFTFKLAQDGNKANYSRPHVIKITLKEGLNTIVLTTGENYQGWYLSFAFSDTAPEYKWVAPAKAATTKEYSAGTWNKIGGYFDGNVGLNAQDNSADYGKTGYADYVIYAEEAGSYTFGIRKMSGSNLSNRVKITLNDEVLKFNGKDYYAFDVSAGWNFAWEEIELALKEGNNTIRLETSLVYVKDGAVVDEGTEGASGMSNWWIDAFSLVKNSSIRIELDTSNVQKTYNPGWKPTTVEGLVVYLVVDGVKQENALSAEQYKIAVDGDVVNVSYVGNDYTAVQGAKYSLAKITEGLAHEGKTLEIPSTGVDSISWYEYAKIEGEGTGVCENRLFYIFEDRKIGNGYVFGSNGAGEFENRQMTLTLTINNTGAAGDFVLRHFGESNNYSLAFAELKVNDGEFADINLYALMQSGEYFPNNYLVYLKRGVNTITVRLQEQYVSWFSSFDLKPVTYQDKTEYTVIDSTREGVAGFYTPEKDRKLMATDKDHTVTFFVRASETGKFDLSFYVSKTTGKVFKVIIDNNDAITLTTVGKDSVSTVADFVKGNHTVKLVFDAGKNSEMDFMKMTKTPCKEVTAIRLDTSEMDLETDFGADLNLSKLKVYVTYINESEETLVTSYYTVDTSNYKKDIAGTYTIYVYISAYPDIKASFDITVKPEVVVNGIEIDASKIANLTNGETLDISKLTVKLCYSDGTKLPAMSSEYIVTQPENFDCSVAGEYTFTVTYVKDTNISTTFKVTVEGKQESDGKSGCNSSISAPYAVLGVLAIFGVGVLFAKKKED